jgi:hypothetical protein
MMMMINDDDSQKNVAHKQAASSQQPSPVTSLSSLYIASSLSRAQPPATSHHTYHLHQPSLLTLAAAGKITIF